MIITTTAPKDPTTGKRTTLYHVQHNEKTVALFTTKSLADAALVSRYLDGGTLPDDECREARRIMKGN